MTTETFLPCFPGFYETLFEFNNEDLELENINEQRAEIGFDPIGYDDVKWNYHDYRIGVSKKAVAYVETKLNELGIECELEFIKLQSPHEYNFSNDIIIINADFDPEHIKERLFECPIPSINVFLGQFLPSSGLSPFAETVKKAELNYWRETSFETFHDFGLACELILNSHAESDFDMDDFVEKSTFEVQIGMDNYSDLIKINIDIDKWNSINGFKKYPANHKWSETDPDIDAPYKQGDIVFCKKENDYAIVLGIIDGFREELMTDLAGMVSFTDIRHADINDVCDMDSKSFGKYILDFMKKQISVY